MEASTDGRVLELRDASGAITITLDGASGVIAKSGVNGFLIAHPDQDDKEIFYASLEGPEAGLYARGKGRLEGGIAEVRLPPHFRAVARERTLTVQVTPTTIKTNGLAVVKKSRRGFTVQELGGAEGETSFDWFAVAERGDIDPIVVVRPRRGIRLPNLSLGTVKMDGTTLPANVMPVIEPRLDRNIRITPQRRETLLLGDQIRRNIELRPDIKGTLVRPGVLQPGVVQPGVAEPGTNR